GCEVYDTASRNGTRVNRRRVGRADLLPGDVLALCDHRFLVTWVSPGGESLPAAGASETSAGSGLSPAGEVAGSPRAPGRGASPPPPDADAIAPSLLGKDQVHDPAAPNMQSVAAAVGEDIGIVAPGVLEGVGEDGHGREVPRLVHLPSE